jgi:hypothetical protein
MKLHFLQDIAGLSIPGANQREHLAPSLKKIYKKNIKKALADTKITRV